MLEGDPANVDAMFDAGFRMMSAAHFFDNEMAGSAHGVDKGGLTDKGRDMIRRMEAKQMIVDLSHGSDQLIDDVLAMATRPVVVSHTGVRGTCDNRRNLSDEQLQRRSPPMAGWSASASGKPPCAARMRRRSPRPIKYAADLIGVDHVALGSDFDGAVPVPFDATGLVKLTEALLAAGFSPEDIGQGDGRQRDPVPAGEFAGVMPIPSLAPSWFDRLDHEGLRDRRLGVNVARLGAVSAKPLMVSLSNYGVWASDSLLALAASARRRKCFDSFRPCAW